jgi:hypothetical protein
MKIISKIISIFPKKVNSNFNFTLTVETNFVFKKFYIKLKNNNDETYEYYLKCDSNESDITKAYCNGNLNFGQNYVVFEETVLI